MKFGKQRAEKYKHAQRTLNTHTHTHICTEVQNRNEKEVVEKKRTKHERNKMKLSKDLCVCECVLLKITYMRTSHVTLTHARTHTHRKEAQQTHFKNPALT